MILFSAKRKHAVLRTIDFLKLRQAFDSGISLTGFDNSIPDWDLPLDLPGN
jgi:hypothetical protein